MTTPSCVFPLHIFLTTTVTVQIVQSPFLFTSLHRILQKSEIKEYSSSIYCTYISSYRFPYIHRTYKFVFHCPHRVPLEISKKRTTTFTISSPRERSVIFLRVLVTATHTFDIPTNRVLIFNGYLSRCIVYDHHTISTGGVSGIVLSSVRIRILMRVPPIFALLGRSCLLYGRRLCEIHA